MLYLMKMQPVFKQYIWGGTGFKDKFGMQTGTDTASEAWMVSANKNGKSIIANGDLKNKTIDEAYESLKEKLAGDEIYKKYGMHFPLLVKFLDCADKLSVQVHPDDKYAMENENTRFGKTEMWYILDAKENAKLIYGFNKDVTKQEFEEAIEKGSLSDILNYVSVKAGDTFYIKSGTLHALLDGLMVAEIQQNSDTTYRVYDYDRKDKNGNKRELHIKKSLDVTSLESSKGKEHVKTSETLDANGNKKTHLVECECFNTDKYEIKEKAEFSSLESSFDILIFTKGEAKVVCEFNEVSVKAGECILVPAYLGKYFVKGNCELLKSYAK